MSGTAKLHVHRCQYHCILVIPGDNDSLIDFNFYHSRGNSGDYRNVTVNCFDTFFPHHQVIEKWFMSETVSRVPQNIILSHLIMYGI